MGRLDILINNLLPPPPTEPASEETLDFFNLLQVLGLELVSRRSRSPAQPPLFLQRAELKKKKGGYKFGTDTVCDLQQQPDSGRLH